MLKLYLKTVSRDLLKGKEDNFNSMSFFNFENGTQKIDFNKKCKDTILAQGTTWIRVYIKNGDCYDFITGSITAFNIDGTLTVMCNDDVEFINKEYIAKLVKKYKINIKDQGNLNDEEILESYYKSTKDKTIKILKKMKKLYKLSNQMSSSRLNIQDSYDYGKQQLEKINMLNILIKQIATENKKEILSLI